MMLLWQAQRGFGRFLPDFIIAVFLVLLAGGTAQALTSANQSSATAQNPLPVIQVQKDTLVVGSEQDFPPFATGMTDATAGGFTVDLWKAVAAEAGLSYTIRVRPFHQILQEFKEGKIDVLINLAHSEGRHQFADFTIPHVVVHGAIFVRKGKSSIRSEGDFAGKSIIVLNADLAHDYAVSKGWEKQLVLVDTSAEGMRLLASGKHDAMLLSKLAGMQTLQVLGLSNIEALKTKAGFSQKFAFAVQEGQSELLGKLNEGLALTKSNGAYNALYDKWFGIYEAREVGIRDLLKYLIPIVLVFIGIGGYFFYQRQRERRESDTKLRALYTAIEQSPASVVITDLEACIQYVNPRFTEVTGYSAAEAIGQNPRVLQSGQTAKETYLELWSNLTSGQAWKGELLNKRKNGEFYWEEAHIAPVKNPAGIITHYVAVKIDISERKQTEEELELVRLITEKSGDPIFMIDDDDGCRMMYVNEAAVKHYGATREEILTWRIPDWDPNFSYEMLAQHVDEIKKVKNLTIESLHRVKGGLIVPVEISLNYVLYKGRHCHFGYFRNISERKEHDEELKRSNVDLEQFSYAVSHDMRQPLRMISSYLQLLEMKLADQLDDEKRGYFDTAIDGAKRIDKMLVALLEYSRVGRMGEPPTWIESRAVLDEALLFLQPAIAEAQAKLNITGEWPSILASHDEILRLLQNLIGNAAKYRVAGRMPEIIVTSEMLKNEWHLSVTDNGVGIIPEQIKRLFKVFQRLHSRDVYEGTGIGLALCRKIAEHHKGRIWAESSGEGQGSRFCVVLPCGGGGG